MSLLIAGDEDVVTGRLPGAVPVTATLDVVVAAARQVGAAGVGTLDQSRPLPDDAEWRVSVDESRRFELSVLRGGEWVPHATGALTDDPDRDGQGGFADASSWPVTDLADVLCRDGLVPVRWRGVELRPGAVRVRAEWDGRRARVWLADVDGLPAGYVDEVVIGQPSRDVLVEHVYRVAHGEVAPTLLTADRTVVDLTAATDPVLAALHATRAGDGELVFLVDDSLACAPVHGLVRSLRLECPFRTLRLVVARADATRSAVDAALAAAEPELVVSGTALLAPRLEPVALTGGAPVLDPGGTVLITGGTGELGRVLATHLVVAHGIRHLVLVSRRGPDAPGAAGLVVSLRAAGAHTVRIVAADVADRGQVAAVLSAVDRPLTAVLHLAGVLDPRLATGQDATRFRRVLAPKIDGARHLHELTRDEPLTAFVLFSSAASVLGAAGQSNYAAACAYLDALATHRHARGLVATSVSWGRWEQTDTGMAAHLAEPELARLRRQGVGALTTRQGCRIFDAAIAQPAPHLVAAVLSPAEPLPDRLAPLREEAVVSLVRREVATVLGAEVTQREVLSDAGVDSLMALELRTRLTAATGVALPATLVTDHPTPNAVARLIAARLSPGVPRDAPVAVLGVSALEHAGAVPRPSRDGQAGVSSAAEGASGSVLDGAGVVPELLRDGRAGVSLAAGVVGDGQVVVSMGVEGVAGSALDDASVVPGLLRDTQVDVSLAVEVVAGAVDDADVVPELLRDGQAGVSSVVEGAGVVPGLLRDSRDGVSLVAVWAALEHAGVVPESLRGKRVGVFLAGGPAGDVAARVAGWFGFRGPSVTVCGSALVAVHLARVAVLRGECEPAVAGGESVLVLSAAACGRAVVVDSALDGAGAGGIADVVDAVAGRRWAEVRGPGARVTVEPRPVRRAPVVDGTFPVVVSARDSRGLVRQAARWADWLDAHPGVSLAGVARTAALQRTHFPVRAGIVAASTGAAAAALRGVAAGVVAENRSRLVFDCSGHSGRWVGMGRALLAESPAFAAAAAECEDVLRPLVGWSVLDALVGDYDLDLDRPDVVRPVLFTAQVCMAAALRALGVVPDAAFGAVAAAVVTGEMSLADGARLVVGGAAGSWETRMPGDVVVRLAPVPDFAGLLRMVVDTHVRGYPVDWAAVLPETDLVDLPTSLCCTE